MAQVGELVNNLQNTQRKKSLQFFQRQPSKSENSHKMGGKKALMRSEDLNSNPCSTESQKTDVGAHHHLEPQLPHLQSKDKRPCPVYTTQFSQGVKHNKHKWMGKLFEKILHPGVPVVAQWLMNPTEKHEVVGSIPGLVQQVKDPALL